MNLITNKFEFLWQKQIFPSSWNDLPYWEWEEYIKLMNKRIDEENKKRKEEEETQNKNMSKYNFNPSQYKFNPSQYKPPKF